MQDSAPRSISFFAALCRWSVPWLCSTTFHALVLASIAAAIYFGHLDAGTPLTLNVQATTISMAPADRVEWGEAVDLASALGYGEDDGVSTAAAIGQIIAQDSRSGGNGVRAPLGSIMETPAMHLASVLPSATLAAGMGTTQVGAGGEGRDKSPGSGGLPAGYVRTQVFGLEAEGRKFAYVFDRSGSMESHRGAPLAAAKSELIASLNDLESVNQFQIIFYNEQPRVFDGNGSTGRLAFATDQNKNLAQKFVGSITASGATRHDEALSLALRMAPDVIFFLTDADEPRFSAEQITRLGRLNQGTIIHTIEFGYGAQPEANNFLVQLARKNGGNHTYVDISKLPPRK